MEELLKPALAFIMGGIICVIAQILIDKTKLTPARILVFYVVFGVFLGTVGLYKPLVDFAGAGASVPLTGFVYILATGVKEAFKEYGLIGALSGGITATSAGIAASVTFGFMPNTNSKRTDMGESPVQPTKSAFD